jgi:protein involved in polysaccharide export with SLBB domain
MNIYRVGIGDVLDIRLLNSPTRSSTLYTVLPGGLLEYPLAGDPFTVTGMTTDEIAERLRTLIKIYDKPQVSVNVREYQSHSVIVTGLVNDPGLRYLRREAVPLYVVITEAQPRTEAGRAVIMRQGSANISVDLADTNAMSTLVMPGDVIKLAPAPPQFYFVGGAINDPGQKSFHAGLTLTQAILAAGGATRFAGSEVKVSRQGADGRLVTTKYNLKKIEDGKVPDPVLQPGDRIEVSRGGW